ncbi:MAG: glycosyltransferase family 4 protein [Planctomycetota bacterium]
MPPDRPIRVLVVAEAANPEFVSVPLVGWSHAEALARHPEVDAHLVTQVRNRDAALRFGWAEGQQFTAIDSEAVAKPLFKAASILRGGAGKGWTTVAAITTLSYYYFERLLWKRFWPDLRSGKYDLVHRITPLSPTTPSLLAKKVRKAGVPFVVGPLNGGVPWPKAFDAARRKEREWLSYVRGAYKLLPGATATLKHASALVIGSQDTWKLTPDKHHDKCVYLPENAVDPARFALDAPDTRGPAERPIRIGFVGRLVPYKGADMLLEAAAPLIRDGKATVRVLGDGPEMANLKALCAQQGIAEGVELPGWVEHKDVGRLLSECDVLGFPSIREFGGGVVLEAMAAGLAPVIVDYAGPSELVTPATGISVPIGDRASIVAGFRNALAQLADNPAQVRPMAERARQRVAAQYTWDAKARQSVEIYRWVLGQGPKPDNPAPLPDPPFDQPFVSQPDAPADSPA